MSPITRCMTPTELGSTSRGWQTATSTPRWEVESLDQIISHSSSGDSTVSPNSQLPSAESVSRVLRHKLDIYITLTPTAQGPFSKRGEKEDAPEVWVDRWGTRPKQCLLDTTGPLPSGAHRAKPAQDQAR